MSNNALTQKIDQFMAKVIAKNPSEVEFHQAVREVVETLFPFIEENPKYNGILERMVEPERVILFRIPWLDDKGVFQVNRGFRIEMNSAIGPYKGGLRFHPTVNLGILKFLAFERVNPVLQIRVDQSIQLSVNFIKILHPIIQNCHFPDVRFGF